MACDTCHGGVSGPAPPFALDGSDDPSDIGVGAHQAHLRDGGLRRAIACSECHEVPTAVDTPGHLDAAPADLVWGALATAGELRPQWDREAATCSSTWCHGAGLTGGGLTVPTWTAVGEGQAVCGACHGYPPLLPHPQSTACGMCHPGTVNGDGSVDVAGGQHIDGTIQAPSLACNGCHGNDDNAAPPFDLAGGDDPALVTVGAHQAHLLGGRYRAGVACAECHVVPTDVADGGHLDAPPADVRWGDLATTGDFQPDWDRDARTCSTTWCHGAGLSGGTNTAPDWTGGAPEVGCGTCHGAPPPLPHPQSAACSTCHPGTVNGDGSIDVAGGQHIDGTVQAPSLACNGCHGNDDNAAPPFDLAHQEDTGVVTVGAHQEHLIGGTVRAGIACGECHRVPTGVSDEGHLDAAPADLRWGTLATTDEVQPEWNRESRTCSSTYCHGATLAGGSVAAPEWTAIGGGQIGCDACHGFPPPDPHPQSTSCSACHPDTVLAGGAIDIDGGKHIDGHVQVVIQGACDACHDGPPDSGAHRVHFTLGADAASYGGVSAVAGAGYGFDCGLCHPLDPSKHGNGVRNAGGGSAEIDLSPTDAPAGSVKALNPPTAVYAPGDTVYTDARGLEYTFGSCSDVYCHSRKEVEALGPVPAPAWDFPFVGFPVEYPPYDVLTYRDYETVAWDDTGLSCDGCHGFPPRTFAETVDGAVGDSHSWIDEYGFENLHGFDHTYEPIACATCHFATVTDPGVRTRVPGPTGEGWSFYEPVPIVGYGSHVNGAPDVAFTTTPVLMKPTKPPFDLTISWWDPADRTCSNVGCHKEQAVVTWGAPYRWENDYECDSCHHYTWP